ncbi:hypothetical protein [Clostridium sp. BJN0013]
MLEFTYYNTEKINNLKDFFTAAFVLIDDMCFQKRNLFLIKASCINFNE